VSEEELKRRLKDGARVLGVGLGDNQVALFLTYLEELKKWNRKVNLTKITTDSGIIARHFLDSLTVCRHLKGSKRLLDMGSGAGFPGIPVKIAMPQVEVTMMDSVEKKVHFLRHIIRRLGLKGAVAVKARAEEIGVLEGLKGSFDCVVSRALSGLEDFFRLAMPYLSKGGIVIAMKGPVTGKLKHELQAVKGYNPEVHQVAAPFSGRSASLVILRTD
jgi:16S rRNA (guanine527-N7)-methyltransferase